MEACQTINKREFQRHVGKYLTVGRWRVTVSDKDVKITSDSGVMSDNICQTVIKTKKEALEALEDLDSGKIDSIKKDVWFGSYGCGCKKVEGKNLCSKHGRV